MNAINNLDPDIHKKIQNAILTDFQLGEIQRRKMHIINSCTTRCIVPKEYKVEIIFTESDKELLKNLDQHYEIRVEEIKAFFNR